MKAAASTAIAVSVCAQLMQVRAQTAARTSQVRSAPIPAVLLAPS